MEKIFFFPCLADALPEIDVMQIDSTGAEVMEHGRLLLSGQVGQPVGGLQHGIKQLGQVLHVLRATAQACGH